MTPAWLLLLWGGITVDPIDGDWVDMRLTAGVPAGATSAGCPGGAASAGVGAGTAAAGRPGGTCSAAAPSGTATGLVSERY